MFPEGQPIPGEETGGYEERDVVMKGPVNPPKESWWKRVLGSKKNSAEEKPAFPDSDVRKLSPREVKTLRETEEARRIKDERMLRETVVTPPKPASSQPEKEAVEVEETPV